MTEIFSDKSPFDLSVDDVSLTEAGILIVDEDPAFQLGLKTFLREYVGFEKVFTARNGKEAIELIESEDSIELLTVDFKIPGMSGIELLEHLNVHAPRALGITMITGFPSDTLRQEFTALNSSKILCRHLLTKPVEFEKLEPVILDCYEELKRSQMFTATMPGEPSSGKDTLTNVSATAIATANRELMAKLNHLEERFEQNVRAMKKMDMPQFITSFVVDIAKLLVAAAIAWLVWQSGLLTRLSEKLHPKTPVAQAVPATPVPPLVISKTLNLPNIEPNAAQPDPETLKKPVTAIPVQLDDARLKNVSDRYKAEF